MRPDTTRTTTDQIINRRYKEQLVPGSDFELDNYLDSINSELTQPLRLKVDVNGSYIVQVEAINIQNPETLVNRVRHPIKKKIPDFAGANITLPMTSGNAIIVTPGVGETLDIPNDQYAKILIQIDDQGAVYATQGFAALTPALAELPKPKSGRHSLGYILVHMGIGGVLDQVMEENIYQFWGPEDNQDYVESLRLFERRSNYKTVTLTGADYDGSDRNLWGRTIEGKKLRFDGAVINFETGQIFASDGISPIGGSFTPISIPSTFWQWYSVNLVPTTADSINRMQAEVLIVPASAPGTSMDAAPRAPWADHDKAIRIGQVAVQGGAILGEIEMIFDANILMKTDLSSEGEGRRLGVDNVAALKALPLFERHHHMLRLVESDLQGRGVLYRWDEFDASSDTTGLPEIGERAKVLEPDDSIGRWLTITAMDIGESVVRTDMIRDDNITLAKLAHSDPYRVIGYNAGGVPSDLFELDLTDGSAGQPTYSFASDQDTGLFRVGDGQLGYSSNGETKWRHDWSATHDYFYHQATAKNVHLDVVTTDSYASRINAYGSGAGTGVMYVGESLNQGGGIGYNGDNAPVETFGRVDAISFYRRLAGVDSEVFWYRATNNNVHFNGLIAVQDNNLGEGNPEPGYLALVQDNNTLYTRTSAGVTTPVLNQTEADARFLRRNASDTPSVDNTWSLGSNVLRWANIWAVTFQGRATSANYADLAERYLAGESVEPGDVVRIGGAKEIEKTRQAMDTDVFGVISTDPAFRMNDNHGDDDKEKPFVALAGRVPCKVVGKIKKGDRLCTSDIDGVAQKADDSADYRCIIGRALQDKDSEAVEKIEIVVGVK